MIYSGCSPKPKELSYFCGECAKGTYFCQREHSAVCLSSRATGPLTSPVLCALFRRQPLLRHCILYGVSRACGPP